MSESRRSPQPIDRMIGASAYRAPPPPTPVDLRLDGNEGAAPGPELLDELARLGPESLRRYPDPWAFEAELAAQLGVAPERVLVTAGGDDAIDRICRAYLEPGRELVMPVPSFEMFPRYVRLAGGLVVEVDWPSGPFPVEAVLAACGPATAVVTVVSPNNPTGAVATPEAVQRLAAERPDVLLLVDLAYAEFADQDLTAVCLELPNAVVVRSLSKAWGLAGLRVGYAVGPTEAVSALRAAGNPYAVARPSLALAGLRLERDRERVERFIERVRQERWALAGLLDELGCAPLPSQANFVLARHRDPAWLRQALAGQGIAVRAWPGRQRLADRVRITCPGEPAAYARLERALRVALSPEALLFDMDGVLADVSTSYREAIRLTAAEFGVELDAATIAAAKAEPDANNDWRVTRRLLARRGVEVGLDEVTRCFEAHYQGGPDRPGLRERERLIPDVELLRRLAGIWQLGVVTGRPRADAERFLHRAGVDELFAALVCMEDAAAKPDPEPVALACSKLGVERAWMLGDAPDDLRAARAAGVLPLGVRAPGDPEAVDETLLAAGAGRVLGAMDELEELL